MGTESEHIEKGTTHMAITDGNGSPSLAGMNSGMGGGKETLNRAVLVW